MTIFFTTMKVKTNQCLFVRRLKSVARSSIEVKRQIPLSHNLTAYYDAFLDKKLIQGNLFHSQLPVASCYRLNSHLDTKIDLSN